MSGRTPYYSLTTLEPGENLAVDDYRFTRENPNLVDLLLWIMGENHHHTGAARYTPDTPSAPTLELHTDAGSLPGGSSVYYRYALVDPSGFELIGSAEALIATQAAVATPGAPTLSVAVVGGALPPGQYLYAISAYQTSITNETLSSAMVVITVPVGGSSNVVTLDMPALPAGATGWNIFRQKPGAAGFFYLASTTAGTYDDDGSVLEDCTRFLPQRNTTSAVNRVTVTLPAATPSLPPGWTWRIYRTLAANDYRNSLLHHVVEETVPGVVDVTYNDLGGPTSAGKPQSSAVIPGTPPKVLLTDGEEVQGLLPGTMIDPDPYDRTNHTNTQLAATISDFNTAVRTNRLDQMAVPTAPVSMNGQKITSLADPTANQDAASKAYVDAVAVGLIVKESVRAATTANITLSGPQTIDGVSVIAGDRVLVKNQGTASQNGIYVAAAGAWTRAGDADTSAEVRPGLFAWVNEGTVNADTGWVLTSPDAAVVLGTSSLVFAQFASTTRIVDGPGLVFVGFTLGVGAGNGITVSADAVAVDPAVVVRKATGTLTGGATSEVLTHNLNTRNVQVIIRNNAAPYDQVIVIDEATTLDTVTIRSEGVNLPAGYTWTVIG